MSVRMAHIETNHRGKEHTAGINTRASIIPHVSLTKRGSTWDMVDADVKQGEDVLADFWDPRHFKSNCNLKHKMRCLHRRRQRFCESPNLRRVSAEETAGHTTNTNTPRKTRLVRQNFTEDRYCTVYSAFDSSRAWREAMLHPKNGQGLIRKARIGLHGAMTFNVLHASLEEALSALLHALRLMASLFAVRPSA